MRKYILVKIEGEGRDKGKCFLVTEMPAFQAEKWAMRALLALGKAGVEVPDEAIHAGAAGILMAGLSAFRQIGFADAEPLLDEMMGCVAFVPDASMKDPIDGKPVTRGLARGDNFNDGDIEEVTTLLRLRGEAIELHLGFSIAAILSSLGAAVRNSSQSHSPTSRKSSVRSSRGAKPA